jgi:hypothetical protein
MAVTRGPLLDLLISQDTKGVTRAFELFLQLGAVAATERDSGSPHAAADGCKRPDHPVRQQSAVSYSQATDGAEQRLLA